MLSRLDNSQSVQHEVNLGRMGVVLRRYKGTRLIPKA